MKELIEEATYLLITLCPDKCPEWVEGFGDCKKGSCTHCRVQKCISDLESLQSKGKTSPEEFLRDKYKLVDFHDLTLNGKPWVELMEEYAQSHANKDEQIKRGDWVFTPDETFGSAGKKNLVFQFDERIEYSLHFGHEPRFFKIDPIVAEFINANQDGGKAIPWQCCPVCNGSGQVYQPLSTGILRTCPTCNGERIIPMHVTPPQP